MQCLKQQKNNDCQQKFSMVEMGVTSGGGHLNLIFTGCGQLWKVLVFQWWGVKLWKSSMKELKQCLNMNHFKKMYKDFTRHTGEEGWQSSGEITGITVKLFILCHLNLFYVCSFSINSNLNIFTYSFVQSSWCILSVCKFSQHHDGGG